MSAAIANTPLAEYMGESSEQKPTLLCTCMRLGVASQIPLVRASFEKSSPVRTSKQYKYKYISPSTRSLAAVLIRVCMYVCSIIAYYGNMAYSTDRQDASWVFSADHPYAISTPGHA